MSMPTICRKEGAPETRNGLSLIASTGTKNAFTTISRISNMRSPPGLVPMGTPINNRSPPKKDATFGLAPKER